MSSFLVVGTVTMQTKTILRATAAAAAIALAPVVASASTVTVLDWDAESSNRAGVAYAVGYGAINPGGTWDPVDPSVRTGNVENFSASPFINTDVEGINDYFVLPTDGNPSVATASLVFQTVRDSFTFLWGSIDEYNSVQFFLDDAVQLINGKTSFSGTDLMALIVGTTNSAGETLASMPPLTGAGNFNHVALVEFSGFQNGFDTVTFKAENVAFEVAMIPLPAAGWLLLTALGGLGVMARRRKQATA